MGALTKAGEELEAVEAGLVQVGSIAAPYYAGKLPLVNWTYAVPFGPGDPKMILDACQRIFEEVPELKAEIEQYNQKLLFPLVIDTYNLTSRRPLVTFEDLDGIKIASIGAYHPKILSSAGALAIHMPVAERYTALQTGVYRGRIPCLGTFLTLTSIRTSTSTPLGSTWAPPCPF